MRSGTSAPGGVESLHQIDRHLVNFVSRQLWGRASFASLGLTDCSRASMMGGRHQSVYFGAGKNSPGIGEPE